MNSEHNDKSDFDKTIDDLDDLILIDYITNDGNDKDIVKGCGSLILDVLFVVLVIWWLLDMLLG